MMRPKKNANRVGEMMTKARVITSWVLLVTLGGGWMYWWLTQREDVVTMDVKDAELVDVLKEMSRQTGRPILVVAEAPQPSPPATVETPAPAANPPATTSSAVTAPAGQDPSAGGERRNWGEPRKITVKFKRRP